MSTTIILFINGAPRSGKDTFADYVDMSVDKTKWERYCLPMKRHLIESVTATFAIEYEDWWERYQDRKDEPWDKLFGMSQREALIWMSEEVMKPKFGKDFYGQIYANYLYDTVQHSPTFLNNFVIVDVGFIEEIWPIMNKFGKENCYMANLFRPDTSFQNDSRSIVTGDMLGIKGFEVVNNGGLKELAKRADEVLEEVLKDAQSKDERRHAS